MDVIMPQLGETVAEGIVSKWHKRVGEAIKADEMLFDVETDKVNTEIPAPVTGVLAEILVEEGTTVKVGARLAVIRESAATVSADVSAPSVQPAIMAASPERRRAPSRLRHPGATHRLSPVVRRLIAEHDLNAEDISGSGRDGRVTREDVTEHLAREAPRGRGGDATIQDSVAGSAPLSSVRKRVAENMQKSWATAPHVLQVVEADFYRVEQVRRELGVQWKKSEGFSLTYLPFIVRAVSIALGRFPRLNATFDGDRITTHSRINLGIAVDLNFEGLMVPVIKDVPGKSLQQIAIEINNLSSMARAGKLRPDDLTEASYTITNNGAYGTVITAPIINLPQVAILSTDAIRKKAVVIEGPMTDSIAIRPIGVLAQSFDHRAVDGAYSAAFLREVKTIIETRHWLQDFQA